MQLVQPGVDRSTEARGSTSGAALEAWPTIAPTYTIEFAESADVAGAVVALDGSVAYAQLHVPAIDLWRVATRYWPEVLGGVLAALALAVLVVMLRVGRRGRRRGGAYCRRCNYDIGEQVTVAAPEAGRRARRAWVCAEGVRCPECGTGLGPRAVVTGRGFAARCAWAWVVLALGASGYGLMWWTGVARADPRLGWFSWPSSRLARLAEARQIAWLQREAEAINRVAVIDLATGERLEDLWQGGRASYLAPVLTPDGERLLVADGAEGVVAIRTRDGGVARRVRAALTVHAYPASLPVAQFAGDEPVAYLVCVDEGRDRSQLVAWDLRTGRAAVAAETALHRDPTRPAGRQVWGRWFSVAEVDGTPMAVSAPGFSEGYAARGAGGGPQLAPAGTTELHVLGSMEPRALDMAPAEISRPLVLSGRGVVVDLPSLLDVRTEERARIGAAAGAAFGSDPWMMWETIRLSAPDRSGRLVVFSAFRSMGVLDLDTRAMVSMLTHPEEYMAPGISAGPCDRWVAAVPFRRGSGTGAGQFVRAVLLYDLGPMREQLAREDSRRAEREDAAGGG